jgi:hemerythrin-like domain-containing protein
MSLAEQVSHLKAEHAEFRALLAELDQQADLRGAGDIDFIKRGIARLVDGIRRHAELEDGEVFPAILKLPNLPADRLDDTFFSHMLAEHKTISDYLVRLEEIATQTPLPFHWPQTFALLNRSLQAHFRKEEEQLFPAVCS